MQKGVASLYILTGVILLLLFILTIPIPDRQYEICPDVITDCPQKWVLGETVFNRIIKYYLVKQTLPLPQPQDSTANWKTYSSGILSFKYPPTYTVKETDKDHFIIYHQNTHPINAEFLINARLTGNLSNFENAVARTKEDIKNASVQQLMNGVKITGILGPGYGEGAFVIAVYLKYQGAAVLFETNTKDEEKLKIFDQILSTFKFLDQENPEGKACGGFAGEQGQFACPSGYKCQYPKPMYPDAQGKCVKK